MWGTVPRAPLKKGRDKKGIMINVLGAHGGHADLQWIPDQPENHMVQEQRQAAWVTDAKHTCHETSANKPEALTYSQMLVDASIQ